MKKIMKLCGVMVALVVAGSTTMAQPYRDYRDSHGRGYDRGHSYHGYSDGGRHYGYYRNSHGELIFGLIGLGVLAAVVSSADRPVYVQQPVVYRENPQVIYVQQSAMPVVVEQPQVVYMQQPAQVVQQPIAIQQPAQVESPQPLTTTVNIQNSNGSFTPVTLRQVGAKWVGPKGEYYDAIPTVGQLRPVYGF
ncbi:MAG: hypothetical protein WCI03_11590 [bacterium]|jgi:hypothetical protein